MSLKNLDLELTVKDGKLTAVVDAPGVKLNIAIDAKAAGTNPRVIWDQLAAVAFSLSQGLVQAGDMQQRVKGKKAPRSKA